MSPGDRIAEEPAQSVLLDVPRTGYRLRAIEEGVNALRANFRDVGIRGKAAGEAPQMTTVSVADLAKRPPKANVLVDQLV